MTGVNLGNFLRAGTGMLVSQAITLACVPILFRLYSPVAFAPWATTLVIVTVVGGIGTLRYELAIVVEREHTRASAIFWLSVLLACGISLVAAALFATPATRDWLLGADATALDVLGGSLWLAMTALTQALHGWVLRAGRFTNISVSQIGGAVVGNGTQLAAGLAGLGGDDASWLVAGSALGQAALAAILVVGIARGAAPASLAACLRWVPELARRYRRFPLFMTPYTFFSIARERAAVLILGAWSTSHQVGLFSQAWRMVNVPVGITSSAVRPVVFHAAAGHGLAPLEGSVNRVVQAISLAGAPWLALLVFDPTSLFALVLGEPWREAGPLAAVMAAPVFLFVITNWMDRILDVAGRQDLSLIMQILTVLTSCGALAWALAEGWSPLAAVTAQCVVLALNYVGDLVIVYRVAGYRLTPLLHSAVRVVAATLAFFALLAVARSALSYVQTLSLGCVLAAAFSFASIRHFLSQPEPAPQDAAAPARSDKGAVRARTMAPTITVVDYGIGNVGAIENMLDVLGIGSEVTSDPARVAAAGKLILPGVGAFDRAMSTLNGSGLAQALNEAVLHRRVPVLGLCLGMQVMARGSDEGSQPGLGWIAADVRRLVPPPGSGLKVPHIGWRQVAPTRASPLFPQDAGAERFYFVHSYALSCDNAGDVAATVDFGGARCCAVASGNIYAVQFHPEKSHRFGMRLLRTFGLLGAP